MIALDIKDLNKTFPGFALKHIKLSLPTGYIMGLIGRNGAGKTTLFKAIMNHIIIQSGSISVFGADHIQKEALAKSQIAYVSDQPKYPESFKLKEIKKITAMMYSDWNDEKFERLISGFELDLEQQFKSLSGGMKAKFDLALALSHTARLILLDEPSAGLDPVARRQILDLLQEEIVDGERSVLFSTHITSDLDRIADYITIIENGEILLSQARDTLDEKWRVIKLTQSEYQWKKVPGVMGALVQPWGLSLVTKDIEAAQDDLPPDAVIETLNLETLMVHLIKGGLNHA